MKFTTQFIRFKVYFDRGAGYIKYIQLPMWALLTLGVFKDTSIGIWFFNHTSITIPLTIILFTIIILILGYFDKRFIRGKEQKEIIETNPVFMDMKCKIDEIHKNL